MKPHAKGNPYQRSSAGWCAEALVAPSWCAPGQVLGDPWGAAMPVAACQRGSPGCKRGSFPFAGEIETLRDRRQILGPVHEEDRRHVQTLPTSLTLSESQLQRPIDVGPTLLEHSPDGGDFMQPPPLARELT